MANYGSVGEARVADGRGIAGEPRLKTCRKRRSAPPRRISSK